MNDAVRNATASATDSLWRAANEARRRAEAEQLEVASRTDPTCQFAAADASHRCLNRGGNELREGQVCWVNARQQLLIERLTAKFAGLPEDECWPWQGGRDQKGYGVTSVYGKQQRAHRAIYELVIGPIPEGLQLDHLCRNRACVNPAHLEPVTCQENLARSDDTMQAHARAQTHCLRGHEFIPENTYITRSGARQCRTCHRENERARRRSIAADDQRRRERFALQHGFAMASGLEALPPCSDDGER